MNYMGSIGIFDSGIGGSTVLKEIIKILPQENYIYYSDSKNNPYGDKSDEKIKKLCDNIVQKLIFLHSNNHKKSYILFQLRLLDLYNMLFLLLYL